MTTPDYHPYLLPTDLRTPEDVLAWLRSSELTRVRCHIATGGTANGVHNYSAESMLAHRLDRERRQACRRGMLRAFEFACGNRASVRSWAKSTDREWALWANKRRIACVQEALAFRAAARAAP